jgi:hypothetical protein
MLPAPFVEATLIALNLPLDLAYRYAVPNAGSAPHDRSPDLALRPRAGPGRPPGWPFPIN